MEFFYHIKPTKMYGDKLLSLSQIEERFPKLAKEQKKIYKGRENLLNKKIEKLDCTWKDVIFLSCIDPKIIFSCLEILQLFDDNDITILKFPISSLKDKEFCLYQEVKNKEEFTNCSIAKYKEEKNLPLETIQYFIKCVKNDEAPLIFSNIKHILLNGELDISEAEQIKYQPILD
jgi:hypothetical protein